MNLQDMRARIGLSAICLSAVSFTCGRHYREEQSATEPIARSLASDNALSSTTPYRTVGNVFKDLSFTPSSVVCLPAIDTNSSENLAKPEDKPLLRSYSSEALAFISFALCAIGFVVYGRRAVPEEKRANHIISRVGEIFDRDPGFYPANLSSIRMWAVNNFALAATSFSMGISAGQLSLGSIYPASVCALSLAILPLSKKYSSKSETNSYVKACENLSYLAIGLHMTTHCFGAATTSTLAVCATAGLIGRMLSWVPLLTEMIKEGYAPSVERSFPSLKSVTYWAAGTTLAAASVVATYGTLYSSAAVIPLGYMFQNVLFLGVGGASYLSWKKKMGAINSSSK